MATTLMNNHQALMGFSNSPSLVDAGYTDRILSMANNDIRGKEAFGESMQQLAATYGVYFHASDERPYILGGGIAIIPVWGSLLHRDRWCTPWATGYGYIEAALQAALADEEVKGIVWDVNSYGGHVAGNFELCETIAKARDEKPMLSIVDSRALSGGYSIPAATGRIIATPSADIGSIGVVLMHTSYEKMLDDAGIEVTFVYAGKHKVDGNPYKNMSAIVQKRLQVEIDRSYEDFVSLVARNRGMEETAVRETEAAVFGADEAKELGLVDDVMQPRAAFAAFQQELQTGSSPSPMKKVSTIMTTKTAEAGAGESQITQEQVEKAATDARAAEQSRIKGITTHAEAEGRAKLANHLAFNTTMSVEEAAGMLAVSGKDPVSVVGAEDGKTVEPGAKTNRLAAALEEQANKTVGVDDSKSDNEDAPVDRTSRLVNAHKRATGQKPVTKA